ncbi:MAG TPA: serine protease [Vicinamibacterales bacterium]|nr:serine protease [Vicinamibacterales bacterium]
MNSRWVVALTAAMVCLTGQPSAQTQEDRAIARDLLAKRGDAVLYVLGTTKLRVNQGGKDLPTADQRIQALVTLLDSSGLGVMSLTALDPSELMSAQLSRGRAAAAAINVTSEQSNLRYRLPDGREVPVRVVLRDKELDLAFLRPVEKLAAPATAVDAVVAKPSPIDSVLVLQRMPELAGWQPTALFQSVQAVVEKPRTFYVLTGGTVGSPVFDLRGRFLGVVLRFKNEADAANAPPIVLPAADIREVAKQAN